MSDYSRYLRGCLGKRAFPTPVQAERARVLVGVRSNEFNAYRCAYCGQWHIGHSRRNYP
jgi:hypothetical protein